MAIYKRGIIFIFCIVSSILLAQENVFDVVYSNELGIDFQNKIIETKEQNILNTGMPYLYAGGGVAIEDFNNDGLPDIFLLGNQVSSKIYINKGNLKFEDRSAEMNIQTSDWCTSVLLCDVNMDGYKDIYILKAPNNSNRIQHNLLFVNVKGEYFQESSKKYNLDFNGGFLAGSFFDYDLDGDQDLYLARYPINFESDNIGFDYDGLIQKGYGSDLLLENIKNKEFKDVTSKSGLKSENGFGISVITSDFNKDNLIDIYVGNDFSESDFLYINKGNGQFVESISKYFNHTSLNTMGIDYDDINNDGLFDILSLDMNPPELSKYKLDFASFDFSIYDKLRRKGMAQQIRNAMQIQNLDGSYTDIALIDKVAFTDWSWSSIITDFNLDGYKDVFITNGLKRELMNQDISSDKLDSIMKSANRTMSEMDNVERLSYVPELKLRNFFFKNKGNLTFEDVSSTWLNNIPSVSNGATIGDLDLDGDMDIVVNNTDTFPTIYKNLSSKSVSSVSFSTKDYSLLNTKITLIKSDKEIVGELRNCKGFISSSLPMIIFPIDINNINEYSFKIDFLKDSKTYHSIKEIKEDTIYYVEDFIKNAMEQDYKVKEPIIDAELLIDLYSSKPNFYKNPFLLKANVFEQLIKKINIDFDDSSELYVGARNKTKAKIISLDKDKKVKWNELDYSTEIDLDIVQINQNGFFLLTRNEKFESKIYYLKWNGEKFLKDLLWIGKDNIYKLGLLKGENGTLIAFGSLNSKNHPYRNLVFNFKKEKLVISEKQTEKINTFLTSFSVKDVVTDLKDKKIFLAGIYMKPSFLFLNENDDIDLKNLSDKRGFFDNVSYDSNSDKVLFSNLSENFRFNLKDEDSLVLYTYDFDGNGKLDPLVCASINGVDYPIYTYNTMTQYLSGVKQNIPFIKDYYKTSIQNVFKDVDFSEVQKNSINSIENQVFDSSTDSAMLMNTKFNSYNNIQSYKKKLLFSGGNNLLNPTLGYMDFAEVIIYDKEEKERIFNSFVKEDFVKNIFILNQNIPIILLQTKKGLYSKYLGSEIID